jgi:hypothetical protein
MTGARYAGKSANEDVVALARVQLTACDQPTTPARPRLITTIDRPAPLYGAYVDPRRGNGDPLARHAQPAGRLRRSGGNTQHGVGVLETMPPNWPFPASKVNPLGMVGNRLYVYHDRAPGKTSDEVPERHRERNLTTHEYDIGGGDCTKRS